MRSQIPTKPRALWIALTVVFWTAFALRVIGIDQQSIWYDEGLSIYYARGTVGDLLRGVSESDHPPLHPLLLHTWIGLCGDSELSVRLLSACCGVLAVALLYRLGRRLSPIAGSFAASGGTLAALLLAVSPLAIWFSQETRGYMLALALVTGTIDVALNLFPAPASTPTAPHGIRWPGYVAYILLAIATLYTHFYSGLVLLALNLAFLVQQLRSAWRPAHVLRWMGAQLIVVALFSPWLPYVAAQLERNATYWHGAVGWRQIVRRTLIAFSVGKTLDGPWALGATWALSLLILLGTLVLTWHRRSRLSALLLWLWMLVPTLFQIALNRALPKFAPRYLMNALPAFLLLASTGTIWLFRSARLYAGKITGWITALTLVLVTATIGGATARSLANHHFDRSFYRPDLRAVASYIESHATPNDLIVLVGGHSYPAFTYYYRGPLPVIPLPDRLLPTTRAPIDVRALKTLDRAIVDRQQLWLVLWQASLADPTGLVTDELEHTYHRLGVGQTFHDVALLLFDVSPGPLLSQGAVPQWPLRSDFGGTVRLLGYDLPRRALQPGETLYLYLYWESLGEIRHDYKVFTQILDEGGQILAQHDKVAGAEAYPTSHWPVGAIVRDRFMLTVDPQATTGRYPLIIGLYRPKSDAPRVPVVGQGARGDHVLLTEIEIQAK